MEEAMKSGAADAAGTGCGHGRYHLTPKTASGADNDGRERKPEGAKSRSVEILQKRRMFNNRFIRLGSSTSSLDFLSLIWGYIVPLDLALDLNLCFP
jgi:hypothetical protein